MADPALPTSVDVNELASAIRWLQDTKNFIDRHILDELRQIPAAVNNPPVTDGGEIVDVGPTHFGLHPPGLLVAARHAGVYNAVLRELLTISADLQKAIDGTRHVATRYREVEEGNRAELNRLGRTDGRGPA